MKHDETIWKNNDQQHATLRLDICCLNWYCMVFQEQNINRFQAVQGTLRHGCGTSLTSTIKLPFYLGTNLLDVLKNPMNKGGYSTYKNPMNKWGHSTYKNPMNKWGYSTYTYIYMCMQLGLYDGIWSHPQNIKYLKGDPDFVLNELILGSK